MTFNLAFGEIATLLTGSFVHVCVRMTSSKLVCGEIATLLTMKF
jgi:hypothetical protein